MGAVLIRFERQRGLGTAPRRPGAYAPRLAYLNYNRRCIQEGRQEIVVRSVSFQRGGLK